MPIREMIINQWILEYHIFTQTHMLFYMQIDLHLQFNIVWLCSIIMMIIQDNYVIIKLS